MAVFRIFRAARRYRREILDKLALGSDTMLDLGNLYTAALPAWIAAGFEQALDEDLDLAGEELLTLGYGSGDAAEVIPFIVADEWRGATAAIGFGASMEFAVDLNEDQYTALHAGRRAPSLDYLPSNEFIIDKVGRTDERQFQDLGIEYYRYVS
jgi:hydroxymethylglutaryl-CoA synthase